MTGEYGIGRTMANDKAWLMEATRDLPERLGPDARFETFTELYRLWLMKRSASQARLALRHFWELDYDFPERYNEEGGTGRSEP